MKLLQMEFKAKIMKSHNIAALTENTSISNKPVMNLGNMGRDRLESTSSIKRFKIWALKMYHHPLVDQIKNHAE